MPTFHEEFMPDDLQAQLLADFDLINYPMGLRRPVDSLVEAREWFGACISKYTQVDFLGDIHATTSIGRAGHRGRTMNSDFHYDGSPTAPMNRTKCVTVVTNKASGGTIFLPDVARSCRRRSSEEMFKHTSSQLTLRKNEEPGFTWTQAGVGQFCTFDPDTELHTAAPLYAGDKKILFAHLSSEG